MQPTGLPVGAFPATDRLAIDEPYTRMWTDLITASTTRVRTRIVVMVVLTAVTAAVALALPDDFTRSVAVALLVATALGGWVWLVNVRWRQVAASVYPRYPWRAGEAMVVRRRPCVVAVAPGPPPTGGGRGGVVAESGGQWTYLRVRRARLVLRQIVARSGRIWLCGPDERKRVMVRVDGMCLGVTARVTRTAPTAPAGAGLPPVRPVGNRPIDEPVLAWLLRRQTRWFAAALAAGLLLVVGGLLIAATGASGTGIALGLFPLLYGGLLVTSLVSGRRRSLRVPKLIAASTGWTPLPVHLDSWQAGGRVFGPARGAIWLPDGSSIPVHLPRASIDLVANIQASHTLWVAGGYPTRGATVAVGVPGYPIIGLAEVG